MTDRLHLRDTQALTELSHSLARFADSTRQALRDAEDEARRTLEWLDERVRHWQRESGRSEERARLAASELSRCESSGYRDRDGRYHAPECGQEISALRAAEGHLRECQENLQAAQAWRSRITLAVDVYRREALRAEALATTHTDGARASLIGLQIRYEAVRDAETSVGAGFTASGGLAAGGARDAWVASGIAAAVSALSQMEELQPGQWASLGPAAQMEALRRVEGVMAGIQGRSAVPVSLVEGEPGVCGGYSRATREITVTRGHFNNDSVTEIVDTIVHEGRHAYQHYVIEHPEATPDGAMAETWARNWDNPLSSEEYGYRRYRAQPLEADAFSYAGAIARSLYGRVGE